MLSFLPSSGDNRWKKDALRLALSGGVSVCCCGAASLLGVLSTPWTRERFYRNTWELNIGAH